MKKLFLILTLLFSFSILSAETVSSNGESIGIYVEQAKTNINVWSGVIEEVKVNGFSFTWLISFLVVFIGSLTILATAIDRAIIPVLIKILPDHIDEKLLNLRKFITTFLGWLSKISGWLSFTKTENNK